MSAANDNSERPPDKRERRPGGNGTALDNSTSGTADYTKGTNQQQQPVRPISAELRRWLDDVL